MKQTTSKSKAKAKKERKRKKTGKKGKNARQKTARKGNTHTCRLASSAGGCSTETKYQNPPSRRVEKRKEKATVIQETNGKTTKRKGRGKRRTAKGKGKTEKEKEKR